jgi:hypothetical protein
MSTPIRDRIIALTASFVIAHEALAAASMLVEIAEINLDEMNRTNGVREEDHRSGGIAVSIAREAQRTAHDTVRIAEKALIDLGYQKHITEEDAGAALADTRIDQSWHGIAAGLLANWERIGD